MVQDEQVTCEGQEKFGGPVVDSDAQQETESGAAPGDCAASSSDAVGSGCVYFIRSPDGAFMKIGFTAGPVMVRFDQIGQMIPGMTLLGYLPGNRATERWLHSVFLPDREQGEWFRFTEKVQAFVDQLGLLRPDVIVPRVVLKRRKRTRTVTESVGEAMLKRAKTLHHPDKPGGSHETFVAIGQAEEVLCS